MTGSLILVFGSMDRHSMVNKPFKSGGNPLYMYPLRTAGKGTFERG